MHDGVFVDGTGQGVSIVTVETLPEDPKSIRHPKYTDSPTLIDRRVQGMRLAMQGKGCYGHRLRRANVLPHQSNEQYTDAEFTKLVHETITNMWLWSKDNQGENEDVVPSQRAVTRVAGMILAEFGRRFKAQHRLDFVMKLVSRRTYTLAAETKRAAQTAAAGGQGKQETAPALYGAGGENPDLRPCPPKYRTEADNLVTGKCPELRRDADGIMTPLEDVEESLDGYVDHFGQRNMDEPLSDIEIAFVCETWSAGEGLGFPV